MTTINLHVGGKDVPAASGKYIDKVRRLTGETIASVAGANGEDATRAIDAAAQAAEAWAKTAPADRRKVLDKAAALILERGDDISALMGREMGAAASWCRFNVKLASEMLREAGAQAYAGIGQVIPSDIPGLLSLNVREPVGVVVGIAPWNAPLILGVRALAMPLALGNTVVLKASEETPGTHAEIVRALVDAGAPEGVVNLVTNAPEDAAEVVEALVAHPETRVITFTGSTQVGRIIAEKAGRHLKRTVMELGGKSPMIVRADADLDEAVAAANFGAFMNQGQICMATERIIVHRDIADEFIKRLAERAAALKVGQPEDKGTELGPLVNERAVSHASTLLQEAVDNGATLHTGGGTDGLYFTPAVISGIDPQHRLYNEESFAPIAPVFVVDSDEEALDIANDTDYGLAAAVFTKDVTKGLELAKRIKSGICHINGATIHDEAQIPFGGVKASGYGRFGSTASVEEFTEAHWITISTESRHYPI